MTHSAEMPMTSGFTSPESLKFVSRGIAEGAKFVSVPSSKLSEL